MKINPHIQETIAKKVVAENVTREPSGRLSASRLGWPLQWMMLWHYKVPPKELDEYTLRKFQRGKDVEDRIVGWIDLPESKKQVQCSYRGVAGIADIVMDYPIEVKSVTNLKFKRLQKTGAQLGHRLQGMLYALAMGAKKFAIAYIASDDYRVLCIEEEVTTEVDVAIDEFEAQLATGVVPTFTAKEKWQENETYNMYADWMKLTQEEIDEKLAGLGIVITRPML